VTRAGARSIVALGALALGACSYRPLPYPRDGAGGPAADASTNPACGTVETRMELIGSPLLLLDTPPATGNLYTTLVWTGQQYLFVWRIFGTESVLMQRIDASGQAVGGNIRLRDYENACDVVWGGGRLGAVWVREHGARNDLMFQAFDELGRPLVDPVTLRSSPDIAIDGSVIYGPRIAAIDGGFALAWNEGGCAVATVNLDGKAMQQPVTAGTRLAGTPPLSLSAAAGRIAVGFVDSGLPGAGARTSVAFASTFTADLAPLGDASLDSEARFGLAQVLATDLGVLALWTHGSSEDAPVRIARLGLAGGAPAIADLAAPVAGAYRYLSPAAWNGDHVVVLWDGGNAGETGLRLARYTANGERQGAPIDLPTAAPAARLYVTAHDGTVGFMWSEEVGGGYQVYFQQARSCP
jgi:hypothetical protein